MFTTLCVNPLDIPRDDRFYLYRGTMVYGHPFSCDFCRVGADIGLTVDLPPRTFVHPYNCYPGHSFTQIFVPVPGTMPAKTGGKRSRRESTASTIPIH